MKGIKKILVSLLFAGVLNSQTDSALLKNSSPRNLKRIGKSALKQKDAETAVTFLEPYVKSNPQDARTTEQLGHAYMEIRDYDRAQRAFLNAYNTNKEKVPEALYYHALMLKSNGKYDSAKINFQRFKKEYKGSSKSLKKQAGKEIIFCDSVKNLVKKEGKIIVVHMDTTINKVNAEGAPIAMDDNTILFTSLRTDKKEYVTEDDTAGVIKKKIYMAKRKKEKWYFAGEFNDLNDAEVNTGNACFSPDRKRIYFTRCRKNIKDQMICAIYVSEKSGNNWSEPVKLPKEINHPKYSSTMPTVTSDPSRGNDVIYFVSNNRKGRGGLDIWYTVYDRKNKKYKPSKNAGSKINTAMNEMSPFFDNETRTLYFSSDGLGGLGGFDIYKTRGDGKKWTGTENMGAPYNTGADDIYYSISTNRQEGFFVSNRRGGNAIKNTTCCDDIYYYKNTEYIHIKLKGTVESVDGETPVKDAIIEIYVKDSRTNEKFLVRTTTTDSKGNYETKLEPDQEYLVVTKKNDLLSSSEEISTKGTLNSKVIERTTKTIRKPKEAVKVEMVQYDLGRSDLTPQIKKALDESLYEMMVNNPEIIVEIHSHTDNVGSDQSNLKLSQKRADIVVNYIISKGIDPSRIKGIGYGESKPVAPNEKPDGSDNPAGRDKNRRTEFKITGTLDNELINSQGVE